MTMTPGSYDYILLRVQLKLINKAKRRLKIALLCPVFGARRTCSMKLRVHLYTYLHCIVHCIMASILKMHAFTFTFCI